jgi:putative transcriptional regulator
MKECIKNEVGRLRMQTRATQEDLASNVNVSRQTIIALEKGNYTPSILLALKVAGYFKMPVEKVFKIAYEK